MSDGPLFQPLADAVGQITHGKLVVQDRDTGTLVPLHPRMAQARILEAMLTQAAAGQPVRLIVPKFRRGGVSTLVQAVIRELCASIPNSQAGTFAHTDADSAAIFRLAKGLHERAGGRTGDAANVIEFANGSRYECRTARSTGVMRGSGLTYLHITELAYLQSIQALDAAAITALLNTVPDAPHTLIVIEGTGEGPTGEFWRRCIEARDNPTGPYRLCFLPWFDDPAFARDLPPDFVLDGEEVLLKVYHGLSDRQLAWRRWKTAQHSTPAHFKREFPATLDECFEAASGRVYPAFEPSRHVKRIKLDETWVRYRAMDWGYATSPFVCLWVAFQPGGDPALTIDPGCRQLKREMLAYRYNAQTDRPMDQDNHGCFVAGTPVLTPHGEVPIERLHSGDVVLSHLGVCRVEVGAVLTAVSPLIRLTLSDTRCIVCTLDHPIAMAGGGWIRAEDSLGSEVDVWQGRNAWSSTASGTTATLTASGLKTAGISSRGYGCARMVFDDLRHCTATCGRSITGRSRMAGTFTTVTATMATTPLEIWNASVGSIISRCTLVRGRPSLRRHVARGQDDGIAAKPEGRGTVFTPSGIFDGVFFESCDASSAPGRFGRRTASRPHGFARTTARWPLVAGAGSTGLHGFVLPVAGSSNATAGRRRQAARRNVRGLSVVVVERLSARPVYNVATSDGTYFANGVLVSNCDALRYLVTTYRLFGRVHVYREFYRHESPLSDCCEEVHRLSGWELPGGADPAVLGNWRRGTGETYAGSVADRSQPGSIAQFRQWGVTPLIGQVRFARPRTLGEGQSRGEVQDGIEVVHQLIAGGADFFEHFADRGEQINERVQRAARERKGLWLEDDERRALHEWRQEHSPEPEGYDPSAEHGMVD